MKEYISFIDFTNMSDEEKYKLLNSKDYETERLNNIINELEEYICVIEYDERNYNETWQIAVRIHNKLKELKGSDE